MIEYAVVLAKLGCLRLFACRYWYYAVVLCCGTGKTAKLDERADTVPYIAATQVDRHLKLDWSYAQSRTHTNARVSPIASVLKRKWYTRKTCMQRCEDAILVG